MKILLVTTRYPWPPRRGDQVRAEQQIAWLAGEHEVTLLSPEPPPGAPAPPERAAFRCETYRAGGQLVRLSGLGRALAGGLPLQSGLFYQPDLAARLARLAPAADLAILQLVRLAMHARDVSPAPLLVDLIDSLALNLERRATVDRPWRRPALAFEAARLAAWEERLLAAARRGLVVSARDRDDLAARLPPPVAARLAVVPIAVPTVPPPVAASAEGGSPLLAITGNLGYFVNADAVRWWLAAAWPRLAAARRDLRLVVAGARPSAALARTVRRAGGELVASPVDLRALLARATLALAPLRCGSGLPIKVLEAWAAGVPVVASPWAAGGVAGRAGIDLAVAETPAQWTKTILDLLEDAGERHRLAAAGRERVAAEFSPEVVGRSLRAAVAAAVAG